MQTLLWTITFLFTMCMCIHKNDITPETFQTIYIYITSSISENSLSQTHNDTYIIAAVLSSLDQIYRLHFVYTISYRLTAKWVESTISQPICHITALCGHLPTSLTFHIPIFNFIFSILLKEISLPYILM